MLNNNPFYFGSIRKLVSSFGTLFNDIKIERKNDNGDVVQTIKVPITYGPKEKWYVFNTQDPNSGDTVNSNKLKAIWPRMSFELFNMIYDPDRKLNSMGMNVVTNTNNKVLRSQYNPVPYNMQFKLHIGSRNIDDSLMILEQILVFFTPDFTITIEEMPDLNIIKDIPIIFNGMENNIDYEGDFSGIRTIVWTLAFTVKGYLYPPVMQTKIIRDSTANIIVDTPVLDRGGKSIINVRPDPIDADPDDDWDYNVTITTENN